MCPQEPRPAARPSSGDKDATQFKLGTPPAGRRRSFYVHSHGRGRRYGPSRLVWAATVDALAHLGSCVSAPRNARIKQRSQVNGFSNERPLCIQRAGHAMRLAMILSHQPQIHVEQPAHIFLAEARPSGFLRFDVSAFQQLLRHFSVVSSSEAALEGSNRVCRRRLGVSRTQKETFVTITPGVCRRALQRRFDCSRRRPPTVSRPMQCRSSKKTSEKERKKTNTP